MGKIRGRYDEMEPMIQQAEREGKWLHCYYQDMWFSPEQLRGEHKKGCFRCEPVNWTLRDPQEQLAEAQRRADSANAEVRSIASELDDAACDRTAEEVERQDAYEWCKATILDDAEDSP